MKGGSLRGRKRLNIQDLSFWEQEWLKSLQLLRDGWGHGSVDPAEARLSRLSLTQMEELLDEFERQVPEQRVAEKEHGRRLPPRKRKEWIFREGLEMGQDIAPLRRARLRKRFEIAERCEIWKALWNARTYRQLFSACERWDKLPEIRGRNLKTGRSYESGLGIFPDLVRKNASRFLSLRRDSRFPKSSWANDDSRLSFIAQGMAGVMIGISPRTAIHRLRTLKHGPGGKLWDENKKRCICTRCTTELLK